MYIMFSRVCITCPVYILYFISCHMFFGTVGQHLHGANVICWTEPTLNKVYFTLLKLVGSRSWNNGTYCLSFYTLMESAYIDPCATDMYSYQIRKIAGCACAGIAGNVFPRRRFQRKPLFAWRTCRDACRDRLPAVTGKTFPAFPAHAHPQFCVSGKRPMDINALTPGTS